MVIAAPTLSVERRLHRGGARYVIGVDEVGRGAIAGPVGVGMCVVSRTMPPIPDGLRDSKLLSERRRETLEPLAHAWALFSAVGLASAEEVDRLGITACLGLAGARALSSLENAGVPLAESTVILDGHHDWLSAGIQSRIGVMPQVKADRDCASVAAASVVAKVHRDRLMIAHDEDVPGYGWRSNKGYGSAAHYAAIGELGPTDLHRRTWLRPPSLFADEGGDSGTLGGELAAPAGFALSAEADVTSGAGPA